MTIEEYLNTSYHPDRDFVDGQVIELNLGLRTHSAMQCELIFCLHARASDLGIRVFPGVRVQVSPTRIRVPDLTVIKRSQLQGEIFTAPAHLCIEVLSNDDTMDYMREKIDDYLHFGIPHVWIVNPRLRKGYQYRAYSKPATPTSERPSASSLWQKPLPHGRGSVTRWIY